jgi:predicted transcriptional regulator
LKFPCEVVVKDVLPIIRAFVAKELSEKYGMTQSQIASKLGVTQASVSYYLGARRGKESRLLVRTGKLKRIAERVAEAVIKKSAPAVKVMSIVCEACRSLRSRDLICEMHEDLLPSLKEGTCKLCTTSR